MVAVSWRGAVAPPPLHPTGLGSPSTHPDDNTPEPVLLMAYTISKDFHFSASHQLDGLHADHPCSRLHGHNYVARITLTADELDGVGFVVDYGRLAPIGRWIDENWDHRHLNDRLAVNPTAEHMARTLYHVVHRLVDLDLGDVTVEVSISETPKTWATYRP